MTMNLNEELIMIISSCEAYSDLWGNHVTCLKKYWPNRCINSIIVTDKKHPDDIKDVDIFSAGDSLEMPQRLKECLKHIKQEYILLTLDDYYIKDKIETQKKKRALNIMKKNKLDYFRFWPYPHEKNPMKGVNKVFWISLEGTYKVNLYPGIWKKSFLENTLNGELSAWTYEVTLTQTAKFLEAKCAYSTNNEFPIMDMIRKGKLLHPAKRFLKKNGMTLNRECIPYLQEIKLNFMYYAKEIIPRPILKKLKKIMVKLGMRFISEEI